MSPVKWILCVAIAVATLAVATPAQAEDCLEVGWRDAEGEWTYHRARVIAFDEAKARVHIKYDFKNGELELKIREKERADGTDVIVLRGRWFEGRNHQRSGRIRLEMNKRGHRARGWYTHGDDEEAPKLDFVLRDCQRRGGRGRGR